MGNNLRSAAEEFMSSPQLAEKKDSIRNAANSTYGKNVRDMLEKQGFEQSFQKGDVNALKESIAGILKTEDGARLMRELSEIMGK